MTVTVNDVVSYRSFAGDVWDAVVVALRPNGYVDVEVQIINAKGAVEPMHLKAIRWYDDARVALPGARPRGGCLGG